MGVGIMGRRVSRILIEFHARHTGRPPPCALESLWLLSSVEWTSTPASRPLRCCTIGRLLDSQLDVALQRPQHLSSPCAVGVSA